MTKLKKAISKTSKGKEVVIYERSDFFIANAETLTCNMDTLLELKKMEIKLNKKIKLYNDANLELFQTVLPTSIRLLQDYLESLDIEIEAMLIVLNVAITDSIANSITLVA